MASDNQTESWAKHISSTIKETVDDATGNNEMKRERRADQIDGKIQKSFSDIK